MCVRQAKKYTFYKMEVLDIIGVHLDKGTFSQLHSTVMLVWMTWNTSDLLHYFTIWTHVEIYLYVHALIKSKDIHRRKNAEGRREGDRRKWVRKEDEFQRSKLTETSGREHDII